jgi:hypothetical protein
MEYGESDYSELWNEMDEMLIQYPELSELWLDRDKLATLRSRFPGKDDLKDYFRKRAFTALVIEKVFRVFEALQDESEEAEGITLDNPELWRIWNDDVKDEYTDYPEFIDFVAKSVFVSEAKS